MGWIKLHKSLIDWAWYSDPNTKVVFLHLLLIANYEPSEYMGETIQRGEAVFGRKEMGAILGLSEQQVRTAIDHLKSTKEITIRSTKKYSVATLVNYSKYQDCAIASNQDNNQDGNMKSTQDQHEINTKITTSKKKEGKKEEEILSYGEFGNLKMTAAEMEKLREKYPSLIDSCVTGSDYYIQSRGYQRKYKDWYAFLGGWCKREEAKKTPIVDRYEGVLL